MEKEIVSKKGWMIVLAQAYVKNKEMHIHYAEFQYSPKTGMVYVIGVYLMNFMRLDIEEAGHIFRGMAKTFCGLPDTKTINQMVDDMDRFCPYLHFHTRILLNFCSEYAGNAKKAVDNLFQLCPHVSNHDKQVFYQFVDGHKNERPFTQEGNAAPATLEEVFDVIDIAISVLLSDIKRIRENCSSELEFLTEDAAKKTQLNSMQKLYLIDCKREVAGKPRLYTNQPLHSQYTPNSGTLRNLKVPEQIEERMLTNHIDIVEMFDIYFLEDIIRLELIGLVSSDLVIKKCKYCGHFFVPAGRIDTEYCDAVAENETKPCNVIGAIKNYTNNTANDPIHQAYLKAYRRMNAKARQKRITQTEFLQWSEEARGMRKRCWEGDISLETFKEWLERDKR